MKRFLTYALSIAALPVSALDLALPIDCDLGETCYIQQFVDHDPTSGASDFRCGAQTYDTHKGTDFALPTVADLDNDVSVLAAADGVVFALRNDMVDAIQGRDDQAPDVTGRECGNGLVLRHPDGWETQYCHLAQGSVAVAVGDTVVAGQRIGTVGLSGQTEFPHLHFSVRQDGNVVDPFATDGATCTGISDTLWNPDIIAPAGGMIAVGFAPNVPAYTTVKDGLAAAATLSPNQNIVFWGFAHGGLTGDTLRITIVGPDGPFHTNDFVLDRDQAQLMRASGRRAPDQGWATGVYEGRATLLRDGELIDTRTGTITVQ